MHELSLANNIIDQVCESAIENGATKIISVRLLLGPLSGVDAQSLEFCFTEACLGTLATGAILVIENSPLLIKCQSCEIESEVNVYNLLCPHCHDGHVKVVSGREFKIMDLEVL